VIVPGPAAIDPGAAPGGFVVHGYRIPDGALVFTQQLTPQLTNDNVQVMAEQGADTTLADAPAGVVLVFYDGDTGDRAWTQPALIL
jgi:hypothetical protein